MTRRGQFKPGQSGNPKGKPKGARHKATLAALKLLDGEAEALSRKAIDLALEGDTTALRLCLERIAPPTKDTPVMLDLPTIGDASGAAEAMAVIVHAVATGELTPEQGKTVSALIEGFRRVLETQELEARVAALEATL